MRKSLTMLMVTIFFVMLLAYQPPMKGNAQSAVVNATPVVFETTANLIDSLKSIKDSIDSANIKGDIKKSLLYVEAQHKEAVRQKEILNSLTTDKN